MDLIKNTIIQNLCYTPLVFGRINKKLGTDYPIETIVKGLLKIVTETETENITKTGKNYYLTNTKYRIRITINSFTCRVITVDKLVGFTPHFLLAAINSN